MFKARLSLLSRFLKFMKPYRRVWLGIFILSQASALTGLASPFLARFAIDESLTKKDWGLFLIATAIACAIFIFNTCCNVANDFFGRAVRFRLTFDLNKALFVHMQKLSLRWFNNHSAGEHLYKFENDIAGVADLLLDLLPRALVVLPKFLLIWVILFWLNRPVALFSLCLVPLYLIPPYYFGRGIGRIYRKITDHSESMLKWLDEYFSRIQLIKVFGREPMEKRRYLKGLLELVRLQFKDAKLDIFSMVAMEMAGKLVVGLMALYGGYLVIHGRMTLGTSAAIMAYFYQLIELQGQLGSFYQTMSTDTISCERIAAVLDEEPEIKDAYGARNEVLEKGGLIFDRVTFGYKASEPVLKDLTFDIEAGRHIALVGHSGCGKTTLLNLLVRLYDPWAGKILIDGFNLKELTLSCLKQQIGFALQEPFLWNDTIENNIRMGRDKATLPEIIEIARKTGVDEIALSLRDGYATVIGENACKLSEGQKQKIAIARALIKAPRILILDEAMSMMDSASEAKILSAIKKYHTPMTLITVSHRLSTAMAADVVYYLASADTMVVDQARNLFERDASFARLFTGQDKIFV